MPLQIARVSVEMENPVPSHSPAFFGEPCCCSLFARRGQFSTERRLPPMPADTSAEHEHQRPDWPHGANPTVSRLPKGVPSEPSAVRENHQAGHRHPGASACPALMWR